MRNSWPVLSRIRTFIQSPGRSIYNQLYKRYNSRGLQSGATKGNIVASVGGIVVFNVIDKFFIRLDKEWEEHNKIIIAFDVDDTTLPFRTATQAECDNIINLLVDCKSVGAYLVIYSCRDESGLDGAVKYLKAKGLEVDAINKNPIKLPYGNSAKPYANIFLDDRAGLPYATMMLREAMYRQRARKWSTKLDYPGAGG